MKRIFGLFKKTIPWLIAVLIFVYLFYKYPPSQIYNCLKFLDVWFFVLFAVGYFLVMYFVDSMSIAKILTRFGHPNSIREIMPARAFTYLMMIINYAASQAAFAFYEYRKRRVPISEMMGIFGIIVFMDFYWLVTFAFITTFFQEWPFQIAGIPIGTFIRIVALGGYAFLGINIIFWNGWLDKIPGLHYLSGLFGKLRNKSFFNVLRRAKPKDYVFVGMMRMPVHLLILLSIYVIALTFNAHIPFIRVMANTPIVFFIGAIPITPGGVGTSNAALVELLKPHISSAAVTNGLVSAGEILFSMSLMWMFANYFLKALAGLVSIKFVSKNLFKPAEDISEKRAEGESIPVTGNL